MRIALTQYDIPRDQEQSLNYLRGEAEKIAPSTPDLWVLPEFCLTGYGNPPASIAIDLNGGVLSALTEIASAAGCPLAGGFAVKQGDVYFNRMLLIGPEGVLAHYDKQRLFSFWGEERVYAAGAQALRLDCNGIDLACFICYDLRFPELFRAVAGAELMIVSANWPSARVEHWTTLLKARAIENQCFVAGVNRTGTRDKIPFPGASALYSPTGEALVDLGGEDRTAVVDCDRSAMHAYRRDFPALKDAQLDCIGLK